ncbi:hypothetical protein NE865_11475 [Phthorimaea operculella]|nr:hypothetical protein NE865_11475 [Phthorimaea operculella]
MNSDRDASSTDEYFVTAAQIFDYCGADSSGTLRVDALMDKFAPFVKTNKAEYNYLKSLLDPEQSNPEVDVTRLAMALSRYSDSQKVKVDLDESFNLKTGPLDSDSGISTDGFQLLEDLQCELREKAHLAHQLRSQLDFTDRQHEEALATLTAERDSLRAHLNMLREENMTLTHVRRDYEDVCDRLVSSERALTETRRALDTSRRCNNALTEQIDVLHAEKSTLQELLNKSKDECHRINEMYLSRQTALREENETLKTEHADLTSRLQDQDEFMQQIIKEKVLLEMELKDMLNKSNQTQLKFDRSIDVSYSEDQMLTALDTLSPDSRFAPENRLLDEDSFLSALKEDQGRATNLSLFDEIRLSFSNASRQSLLERDDTQCEEYTDNLDISLVTIGTQTDDIDEKVTRNIGIQTERIEIDITDHIKVVTIETQTDIVTDSIETEFYNEKNTRNIGIQTEVIEIDIQDNLKPETVAKDTQTEEYLTVYDNNNCGDCIKCLECVNSNEYTTKLESDLRLSKNLNHDMQNELDKYDNNLIILQNYLDEGNARNDLLETIVNSLKAKISLLEVACGDQKDRIDSLSCETFCAECQTDCDNVSVSTQASEPCAECSKAASPRSLRRYFWEPVKWLFQVFAVVSFVCAVSVLYGISRRWSVHCERAPAPRAAVPWRWLDAQEFMDLLLRIEYVADVPM